MKIQSKIYIVIPAICFLLMFTIACKKNPAYTPTEQNDYKLSIISLNVSKGGYDKQVIIHGTGFTDQQSDIKVYFNGKEAPIDFSTFTDITVRVPVGAGTGKIKVNVKGIETEGPIFNYQITGTVSTLAGNGEASSADGVGYYASFHSPFGITTTKDGLIYVTESKSFLIRKITPSGAASRVHTSAEFNLPFGITADAANNLYVSDFYSNQIKQISPTGLVTVIAGTTSQGSQNGPGNSATFNLPSGVAVDASGNIFVVDRNNNLIRKITQSHEVSTFAGSGAEGHADGIGTNATFHTPYGIAIDKNGNLYVTDTAEGYIRKITPNGIVTTLAGGGQQLGSVDGVGHDAQFTSPVGIAVNEAGMVFVTDVAENQIRMITPVGEVTTIAGSRNGGKKDGPGISALFKVPHSITAASNTVLYVTDSGNNLVRKIILE